ncbi:MAG: hypothetical protein AAF990_03595 [Bacteroidota bacterium]
MMNRIGGGLFFIAFVLLFVSELLEQSMFVDGLWYASISRNLAEGQGCFWQPQFSALIFARFFEHPPLVFGLQALFFKLLGDHFWTERFFVFIHYLSTAGLMLMLWRQALEAAKVRQYIGSMWFLPLLFWQCNLVTYFFQPANLLDASLAVFDLLAVFLLLKTARTRWVLAGCTLAGLAVGLAVWSKGPVGLFPLAFWLCYKWSFPQIAWQKVIGRSMVVLFSMAAFLCLVFGFSVEAQAALAAYWDTQLLASLSGERRQYYFQENRLFIIGRLLWVLVPMLLACVLSLRINRWRVWAPSHVKLFLAIGLTASLPLTLSPRQALPYLLPAIPYFSLAFALVSVPLVQYIGGFRFEKRAKWLQSLQALILVAVFATLFMAAKKYRQPNQRDAHLLEDVQLIGEWVGPEAVIASDTFDMYISGYLMRLHKISLDTAHQDREFLLRAKSGTIIPMGYNKLPLSTQLFDLYQKSGKTLGKIQ